LQRSCLRAERHDVEGRRAGLLAHAVRCRSLRRGEGAPPSPRAVSRVSHVSVLCALITAYLVVLILRAILSWFPIRPGTTLAAIARLLSDLTEPVVAPVRRMIPPAGMFDIAFLAVFFGLVIVRSLVCPGGGF